MRCRRFRLPIALWLAAIMVNAEEWPQHLGPTRNGVYAGAPIAPWPSSGPPLAWKKDVGQGFSAPVVAQGKLILFHRVKNQEVVEALDAASGRTLWTFGYATAYRDDFGFDEGPRGAPAVADGRVYTFGAEGALHAIDFATGKKLWSVETHRTFRAPKGFFGAACSPLVEGKLVIVNVGGAGGGIVAFDRDNGKTVWTATADEAGYSSPIAATIGGTRQVLCFNRAGLVSLDPASGKVRFRFPWRSRSQASANAATPLVIGDLVFLSASYGTGAALLRIGAGDPAKVWASDDAMSNHYATSVHRDGFLYGYHGRQEEGPSLRCIELKTGKVRWDVDGFRAGTVTLAGDRLLLIKEGGEAVLAAASPDKFQPLAQARLLPGTIRAYPAIADGRLFVRNETTLACFLLK